MKKKILFFTATAIITEKQRMAGKLMGAQFRNAVRVDPDNLEPCDYVAGAVPECYAEYPVYGPEQAAADLAEATDDTLPAGTDLDPSDDTEDASDDTESDTEQEDSEESEENTDSDPEGEEDGEEITTEYLAGLDKAGLLELAVEENIGLTSNDKKSAPKLRKAIAAHFEISE